MVAETLVWADQTTGTDEQLADFDGISWTADDGSGSGTVNVTATLLPGTDVTSNDDINPGNDSSELNTLATTPAATPTAKVHSFYAISKGMVSQGPEIPKPYLSSLSSQPPIPASMGTGSRI